MTTDALKISQLLTEETASIAAKAVARREMDDNAMPAGVHPGNIGVIAEPRIRRALNATFTDHAHINDARRALRPMADELVAEIAERLVSGEDFETVKQSYF